MREIDTGLWHWTATHPKIGWVVSSYYLSAERVLIDPLLPPDGIAWFERQKSIPEHVLLSCRHHDRDSWTLQEAFSCQVHCVAGGCHELESRGQVSPFEFGDELPGGIVAHEVDAISPDETAFHIPAHAALACADGVIRTDADGDLQFVPDSLMDDPESTKAGLAAAFRALTELSWDRLLLAHGQPIVTGGRGALRAFATR